MRQKLILIFVCFSLILPFADAQVHSPDLNQWHQIKGAHFVVYVLTREDEGVGRDVLRAAEDFYDKIARQIGYSRYGNFWTWDERVKIIIFPDQVTFSVTTNQPLWAKGYAVRDSKLFESRAIVTFKQEDGFLTEVLPHEIGHLILRDFIGFNRPVPLWFDEGVAQLQEAPNEASRQVMAFLAQNGQTIPFDILGSLDIRRETDNRKVMIFYAQSRLVLEFLIRNYGQDAFERLCREMKDGMTFDEALRVSYSPTIDSMKTLESKWVADMSGQN